MKQISKYFFYFAGVVLAFIINFNFIEPIIIPDPCYYHTHSTTKLFDVFYGFPVTENGHPSANFTNLILTTVIGFLIGNLLYKVVFKRKK
jgi:hypothetical protein